MHKRPSPTLSKIVATIGPASDSPEMVQKLINAGVGIFRVNFSHGSFDDHAKRVATVRRVARELEQPVAILGDLQGPKIRIGKLEAAGVELEVGRDVLLALSGESHERAKREAPANVDVLPSDFPLARDVEPGHRVLINDGLLRLLAVEREPGDPADALRCRVLVGGLVTSRKGINLPDSDVRDEAITAQDWECVEWAVAQGLDFLALSFVRRAEEVKKLKAALASMCPVDHSKDRGGSGSMIPVVAKIEQPQALKEIDAIVEASDAIMVARGDLGVEMDIAEVPVVQKMLLEKCDEWGKACIVATQMLESMITASTPTRAEATDVANAIFDGADAVMLSAETATGKHPTLVVETMRRIVGVAEARIAERCTAPSPSRRLRESRYRTAALAHGAWHVAMDLGARLVVCWSQNGGTARYLSQTGLPIPVVAYSSDEREVRRMALLRGVTPRLMELPAARTPTLAWFNLEVDMDLLELGWVEKGDPIVLIAGAPLGMQGTTNTLAAHSVGSPASGFMAQAGGAG
jgi:pyruvate kinase